MQRAREGAFESETEFETEFGDGSTPFAAGDHEAGAREEPQEGSSPVALARAIVWARVATAEHPYAVLGGAAALGGLLGAGPALAARAVGLVAAFAVRAAVRAAADQLSREAGRLFEPQPEPEPELEVEEDPEMMR